MFLKCGLPFAKARESEAGGGQGTHLRGFPDLGAASPGLQATRPDSLKLRSPLWAGAAPDEGDLGGSLPLSSLHTPGPVPPLSVCKRGPFQELLSPDHTAALLLIIG